MPKYLDENTTTALAQNLYEGIIDSIFPVGALWLSTTDDDPNKRWSWTTWEKITEGQGLVQAGSEYALGSTGGSKTHTLTTSEMPSHTHSMTGAQTGNAGSHSHTVSFKTTNNGWLETAGGLGRSDTKEIIGGSQFKSGSTDNRYISTPPSNSSYVGDYANISSSGSHSHSISATIGSAGGGSSFSIMNPYLAVNIWKRIS